MNVVEIRVDALLTGVLFSAIIDPLGKREKQQAGSISRKGNFSNIYIQGIHLYKPVRKIISTTFIIGIKLIKTARESL